MTAAINKGERDMPEPTVGAGTVTVTLLDRKLSDPSPFVIDPTTLPLPKMRDTYQVTFTLDATAVPGAKLIAVGQTVNSSRPAHVTETMQNGDLLVTFPHPGNQMCDAKYKYEVAVQLGNGVIIVSPDPEIEILPGP
jgi:hypothetical protein